MDEWQVDAVIVGSQKGLMLPPGLAIVSVGARAWERVAMSKSPRFVLDWEPYRAHVPATPPLSLMHQLDAALDLIDRMGAGGVFRRREEVAQKIRALVSDCRLEVYARRPGNGITGVLVPPGMDLDRLRKELGTDYSILIAGGLGRLEGKIFRIGHVGHLADRELDYFCSAFRETLSRQAAPGSGMPAPRDPSIS